jgi:hypothetical protein
MRFFCRTVLTIQPRSVERGFLVEAANQSQAEARAWAHLVEQDTVAFVDDDEREVRYAGPDAVTEALFSVSPVECARVDRNTDPTPLPPPTELDDPRDAAEWEALLAGDAGPTDSPERKEAAVA